MPSIFKDLPEYPPDPILSLTLDFQADKREEKIDLSVGVYRNEALAVPIMRAVKEAEKRIVVDEKTKEYLPIDGAKKRLYLAQALLFGSELTESLVPRLFSAQALGGTGALCLGGELLRAAGCKTVYIPAITWANHKNIFPQCGLELQTYPYPEGMSDALKSIPSGSVVLLHGCCHNPTGIDPTQDEWMEISQIMKRRQLIPFFDVAYQGFAKNIEDDAWPVRYFAREGHEMCVAHSYSKNFGLYGERSGAFFVLSKEKKVGGVTKRVIRSTYSNPPRHSSGIVVEILKDKGLREMWLEELEHMRNRIRQLRQSFARAIGEEGLLRENGMFSYLKLSSNQVKELREKYGIYMAGGGRMNVSGLCDENIPIVAKALLAVR